MALNVLEYVKADLQLQYTTHQDEYLVALINAAKIELEREGVKNLSPESDFSDLNLTTKYAAYLYRLRAAQSMTADSSNNKYFATTSNNQGIMPHMLRRLINNRIFQDDIRSKTP